jgi:hypothetical protein
MDNMALSAYRAQNLRSLIGLMSPMQQMALRRVMLEVALSHVYPAVQRDREQVWSLPEMVDAVDLLRQWLQAPTTQAWLQLKDYFEYFQAMQRWEHAPVSLIQAFAIWDLNNIAKAVAEAIFCAEQDWMEYLDQRVNKDTSEPGWPEDWGYQWENNDRMRNIRQWQVEVAWATLGDQPAPQLGDLNANG